MFNAANPLPFPKGSFNQKITPPDTDPDDGEQVTVCFSYTWLPYVLGALDQLLLPYQWEGDTAAVQLTQDRANLLKQMFSTPTCPADMVDTPFWDDSEDVGDEAEIDEQTWYGEVTNPAAAADELDFVENALVWIFTGLLAIATPEVGFAPAIAFHTIAPKFIIAQKRGDFATVIRIVLDGQDVARVDTTPNSAGDIIEIPVIGDESLDGHDLLILNTLP